MEFSKLRKIHKIKKLLHPKRLKIAEQILIVLFIALLIPMIISGLIINNINQQAMRKQLINSAVLIANMVSDEIDVFFKVVNGELTQINTTLNYLPNYETKQKYLKNIQKDFSYFADLKLVNTIDEVERLKQRNKQEEKFILYQKTINNKYLVAVFNNSDLNNHMFKSLQDDARQIYIIDSSGNMISQHNYTEALYNESLSLLPKNIMDDIAVLYGNKKNQPIVYLHKTNPELMIIVNTTEKITNNTINENRFKLLMAVFISSLSIFIIVALYIYYMYINIRQLFKGIMAVSKGSYERRIRLLKSIFTPHEIVFLASEFNKMASEIHKSYIQLKEQNVKLEQLNEFRSNLIDTVSHELRTPLTSIQGYTSRLLRTDIQIDEETRQKSLRIIKKQSERLKRLIEDLLVIPDIERDRIRVALEPVWISDTVETAITLVKNNEEKEIINNLSEDFPLVVADKDRAEQVIVNLIENAIKYSKENTPIVIFGDYNAHEATVSIANQCDKIPEEKLNSLFEKFIRMDDKTTRTTRGTGLGLFIVKGLVEAMKGKINISSNEEYGFKVDITLPLFKSVTLKP
ncbi:GHKL domain-containing protein [bacterium]|nr:GHKL domain-containing protein [bacterium]